MNLKGRAEVIRLVFAAAEVEYEDIRISMPEFKQKHKADSPFGQLPVFEMMGVKLCQSNTIARYMAKQHGLAGKDEWENMRCDMVVDAVEDLIRPFMHSFRNQNQELKVAGLKKYEEEQLPRLLGYLEAILTQNNGGDGFFVGDSLTWADLAFHVGLGYPDIGNVKYDMNKFPKLKALMERIEAQPRIAKWLKERPQTEG